MKCNRKEKREYLLRIVEQRRITRAIPTKLLKDVTAIVLPPD